METIPSPAGRVSWTFACEPLSYEKAGALTHGCSHPGRHSGTKSCKFQDTRLRGYIYINQRTDWGLERYLTCRYNCKCSHVQGRSHLTGHWWACWGFVQRPPHWRTPGSGHMAQDEQCGDWVGGLTKEQKHSHNSSLHFLTFYFNF